MNQNLIFKKLLILLIIPFLIATSGSYFYNKYAKDRYLNSIKISTLYTKESVTLQSIRMMVGFDPQDGAATNFAQKLNNEIYNNSNICGKINRINNIMPVIVSSTRNNVKIEIATTDKKLLDSCKKFIINEIGRENLRIVNFYKSLLSMRNDDRNVFQRKVDINEFITFYNNYKKKLILDINISPDDIDEYLTRWIMQLIPKKRNLEQIDNSIEQIEFFKLISDNKSIEKKIDLKFYFLSLFILSFLITIMLNKVSQKKTNKIVSNINKLLS